MAEVRYAAGPLTYHEEIPGHHCKLSWGPRSGCSSGVVGPNLSRLSSSSRILHWDVIQEVDWNRSDLTHKLQQESVQYTFIAMNPVSKSCIHYQTSTCSVKPSHHVQIAFWKGVLQSANKCPHAWMEQHIKSETVSLQGADSSQKRIRQIPFACYCQKIHPLLWKTRGKV